MFPFPLEPPPPPPTALGGHRAPGWAPCVYSNFPPVICFTYGNVYVLVLLSQFIPSSAVSTSLFSMSASLFLPHKYLFI